MSEQRKGRWEDWEKDYLFKHSSDSTDAELASHLGRSKTSIIEMRRKLKIKKNSKSGNTTTGNKNGNGITNRQGHGLSFTYPPETG